MRVIKICKSYKNKTIFQNFSYDFKENKLYLILGKSGIGKTTLLNIISQKDSSYEGLVEKKEDVFYLSIDDLIPFFTVKENIELIRDIYPNFKLRRDVLGLSSFFDKRVDSLSMGERQRVVVYISMCVGKKVILLDEPTSSLDIINKKKVINLLEKESKNRTVIVVSHEANLFKKYELIDLEKVGDNCDIFPSLEEYHIEKRILNAYKWSNIIVKKNLLSFIIFVLSIFSLSSALASFGKELSLIDMSFKESYSSGELLYKENNVDDQEEKFYSEVVLPLNEEVSYYGYSLYSEQMYNSEVRVDKYYYSNGFLFSNVYVGENIKEKEVIISINLEMFCIKNLLDNCNEKTIKESLIGKKLIYICSAFYEYNVKDVLFGEERIFVNNLEDIKNIIIKEYDNYQSKYYMFINKGKKEDFYRKINEESTLLKYDFSKYYEDQDYIYFFITPSKNRYFSHSELKENNLLGCSINGISCDAFSFLNFKSLHYIENISVKDEVKFESMEGIGENEIVISKGLSKKIKKNTGDSVTLKYYIDGKIYLDEFKIIGISDSSDIKIYKESDYSYKFMYRLSGESVRIEYAFGNGEGYLKSALMNEEIIIETKKMISNLLLVSRIILYFLYSLVVMLLFFLEYKRFKKHRIFFAILKRGNIGNITCIFNMINIIYLGVVLFLFPINLSFGIIYLFIFILFYIFLKVKTQVSLG